MTDPSNVYRKEILAALPRLLGSFDTDPLRATLGVGDRFHWAWKLIDFANGTFQGAAHGLSRLLEAGLLPEWLPEGAVLDRVNQMVEGAAWLTRRNGSLEEAFPHESSFCVTALVAFDLLVAMDLLHKRLSASDRNRWMETVAPMIGFLHRSDEAHGLISNHLATAAACLFRWSDLTDERGQQRGSELLQRILAHQSDEGWFLEYEGADPGYQTLCTYYLADLHLRRPDLELEGPIARSIRFLSHFAHPDGSFGGHYGSRNTRLYYPAGLEALAAQIPEAAALASFMRRSIAEKRVVTLASMDPPNLVPMFNAYCWAAVATKDPIPEAQVLLPCEQTHKQRTLFRDAGLLVDRGAQHDTIIALNKGGVCYHFRERRLTTVDCGAVATDKRGRIHTTQAYLRDAGYSIEGDTLTLSAPFSRLKGRCPGPIDFVILRLLSLTLMRSIRFGNWIKIGLVRMLIRGNKPRKKPRNLRVIRLGPELRVTDDWIGSAHGLTRISVFERFSAIHMASAGYWQVQDDAVAKRAGSEDS